jgi:hypothetical protein
MECVVCGIFMEELLSVEDDGKKRLVTCPNHQLMIHLGMLEESEFDYLPSEVKVEGKCNLCDKDKIFFKDTETVYDVCKEHANKLVMKNLSPREFKILYAKYPKAYLLHDDFYVPETGLAIQPVDKHEEK